MITEGHSISPNMITKAIQQELKKQKEANKDEDIDQRAIVNKLIQNMARETEKLMNKEKEKNGFHGRRTGGGGVGSSKQSV